MQSEIDQVATKLGMMGALIVGEMKPVLCSVSEIMGKERGGDVGV